MPVHDWTRVTAGTFHHFHSLWIARLSDSLNMGLLPSDYLALVEQHTGDVVPDVLTLSARSAEPSGDSPGGGLALAEAPPKVAVRMKLSGSAAYRQARKTLVVRHRSGRRIVAMLEIVSQANKDRERSVERFVRKAESALRQGIHLLVIDLLPPGLWDPQGVNAAIWDAFGGEGFQTAAGKPLTLGAYLADPDPEAFVQPLAVGDPLPPMPRFLDVDHYVNVPLESTYAGAYSGVPAVLRDVVEGRAPAET
jgi:hypothetical protein